MDYESITDTIGMKLDQVILLLQQHHKDGKKVCCEFNGTMLYSDTVDMESTYKNIVGMTKTEFDEYVKKVRGYNKP